MKLSDCRIYEIARKSRFSHPFSVHASARANNGISEMFHPKTRNCSLIVTTIISYSAIWELIVRGLILSTVFPFNISLGINYALVFVILSPILAIVVWVWLNPSNVFPDTYISLIKGMRVSVFNECGGSRHKKFQCLQR